MVNLYALGHKNGINLTAKFASKQKDNNVNIEETNARIIFQF